MYIVFFVFPLLTAFILFNFFFKQCDCNVLVKLFTNDNMSKHHSIIQDLISKVTFTKVESMLQVSLSFTPTILEPSWTLQYSGDC